MPELDSNEKFANMRKYLEDTIHERRMTEDEFAKKVNMGRLHLKKLLSGREDFKLSELFQICSALNISVDEVLRVADGREVIDLNGRSDDEFNRVKPEDRRWYHILESDPEIVYDPSNEAFKGMFGKYHFYCKPTDKKLLDTFQKGEFRVIKKVDSLMRPYVGVELRLPGGIVYEGDMFYSCEKRSCIVITYAKSVHDFCVMEFLHKQCAENEKLLSRVMLCMSSSSNPTASKPVVSKAIISRKPLANTHLENIAGQFRLNTSTICVDAEIYEKTIKRVLPRNIEKLMVEKRYYTIKERTIFESRNRDDIKLRIRDVLRNAAIEPYFIKIPYYIEDRLEAYINKLR